MKIMNFQRFNYSVKCLKMYLHWTIWTQFHVSGVPSFTEVCTRQAKYEHTQTYGKKTLPWTQNMIPFVNR